MAQHIHSRTIHTVTIDLQDDILAKLEAGDEVEIVLQSRNGQSRAKKLSMGDVFDLVDGNVGYARKGPRLKSS